ncbi:MAG: 3-methyl-2-oxobutanoate hydroxymethyltransferase [Verrucomicrobiales bacterium]|jgi:3-methyl-2-oxobutanoate hydroxymethyltransferase|nr:3-methyl-2-oxobutanoate hydroxymethyltransferase [Verrucomicrobiales bacterium]
MPENRVTWEQIKNWREAEPIFALTAYDYPTARLLDEAGVDILHVGDSLGMTVLGCADTVDVTISDMAHHTKAVARARRRALVTADLPCQTYATPVDAVCNARLLVAAGTDAVKIEGGADIVPQIRALSAAGIPVMGHIGLLPQRIRDEGGIYRKKGRTDAEVQRLREDAVAVQEAGVFAIVLEAVVSEVAVELTRRLAVPTIGIASGAGMRGQIRVIHDVLGLTPWFDFPHVKPVVNLAAEIKDAVRQLKRQF